VEQNRTLENVISIKGMLLMLDGKTPHVAVPVQAICAKKVIATTLSNDNGRYQFADLKPGQYQIRCHVLGGYVYYSENGSTVKDESKAVFIQINHGEMRGNINLFFAEFKKGTWRNYTALDGLAFDTVNAIHGTPDGIIWFATGGGSASRYDGKEFVNFTTKEGLAHNVINTIYSDQDGVMWFGTDGGGVYRYDGKKFTNFTKNDGLVDDTVGSICADANGVVWFGTSNGVSRYDGKGFSNMTTEDGLANNLVYDINIDPDGVMWFATHDGISRYDGRNTVDSPRFVNFTIEDGLVLNSACGGIYRDHDGIMWFGTYGGISRYDGHSFTNFTRKDGLSNNPIKSIQRDPDGSLWLGIWRGGLARYDRRDFTSIATKDELINDSVNVIHLDPDGAVWIGMQWVGLFRYDGRKFDRFTMEDGLPYPYVWAIHRDPDGVLWIGTGWYHGVGGLARYDGKKLVVPFDTIDGLAGKGVSAIYSDPAGNLWLGTFNGVWRYDGKDFTHLDIKDFISVISSDSDGAIWFGVWWGGGVCRYDGKELVNFTIRDGLASEFPMAIYCDPDGIVWVATLGGGVCMYDGTAWSSLGTRDGLAGNQVWDIKPDPDGSLCFGTNGGLTHYFRNATPPKVNIVSITTDQAYTDLSAIPVLIAGQRVTIEYCARDSKTVPEKRQYRCRILEARDNEGNVSTIPYLPPTKATSFDWIPENPGTYVFEVQAIDRDLNYSEPAVLSLIVQPDPKFVSLQTEVRQLRQEVRWKYSFDNIIGNSESIRMVHALMERAIDSGLTVLITGETGTGKELVAKAIHHNSRRKDRPLRALNCGAVPKDLVASTLFGHRRGAFTGANEDRMGLFEEASGGTVLLDEIGEMPEDTQTHLLRVLEEREVLRLGENVPRSVDVWVIAMSKRDLEAEVEAGRFRDDLFYRLSEFPIEIPPLRERPQDIPILAEHFLKAYSEDIGKEIPCFAPGVLEMLQSIPGLAMCVNCGTWSVEPPPWQSKMSRYRPIIFRLGLRRGNR